MGQIDRRTGSIVQQPGPPSVAADDAEFDVFSILRIVRRRIALIVTLSVLFTLIALPAILSITRKYAAETRVLISAPITANLDPTRNGIGELRLATELERLASRDIANKAVVEFGLDRLPEFNPELREEPPISRFRNDLLRDAKSWISGPAPSETAHGDPLDPILQAFAQSLSIRIAGPDVVLIGFQSSDPVLAARVANGIVRIYLDDSEAKRKTQVEAATAWLSTRVESQRQRVDAANQAVKALRTSSGLTSADPQVNGMQAIATLTARQELAAQRREQLTAALDELGSRGAVSTQIDGVSMGDLDRARGELRARVGDLNRLVEVYAENRAEVVGARARVREAVSNVDAEQARLDESLRDRLVALGSEERRIGEALSQANADLVRLNEARGRVETLDRDAAIEQTEFDKLEQQLRSLRDQLDVPAAEVEILAPAAVPTSPGGTSRTLYLLGAMIGAAAAAFALACVRELLDRGIRSQDQLEGIAGLSPVGMVPLTRTERGDDLWRSAQRRPGSMFADSIRGLILSISRSNGGVFPRSLLVTSSLPSEGKSTLAAAIAAELCANGHKVLLVDCDLRRGRLHEMFGTASLPGVAELLDASTDLDHATLHDVESDVALIPRGGEMRGSIHRLQEISEALTASTVRERIVIFDSAPVLATSETSLLASLAERTVLVVRWGKVPRSTMQIAIQKLSRFSNRDICCVLNGVDPRRHSHYSYRDAGLFTGALRKYYPSR